MNCVPNTLTAPRQPSFNEANVNDKSFYYKKPNLLTAVEIEGIDQNYRDRVCSLQGINDNTGWLMDHLTSLGVMDNTYVIFTSDNGYMYGEHRIPAGKGTPYREVINVPFIVRGPGIPMNTTTNYLASNADFAPTVRDWLGLNPYNSAQGGVDGRTLKGVLTQDPTVVQRTAVPVISLAGSPSPGIPANFVGTPLPSPNGNYHGVTTPHFSYFKVQKEIAANKEMYNLVNDPYQMENMLTPTSTAAPSAAFLAGIHARSLALSTCQGATCRALDSAPIDGYPIP